MQPRCPGSLTRRPGAVARRALAGERLRARLAEDRARAAVAPRVRALYAELGDAQGVTARLEADPALSPGERAAALRETLRQQP